MGLYTYEILDDSGKPTGETLEEIFKWNQVPDTLTSSHGRVARRKGVEVIAKIADTSKFGLNGVYNRGLGCVITGWEHYEQVMKEKNLTPESDFGKHHFEEKLEASARHMELEGKITDHVIQCRKESGLDDHESGTLEYAKASEVYWEKRLAVDETWLLPNKQ